MAYAIISIGGKQHRVREGERLLVNRLPDEEGATLHPDVLLLGGDGSTDLAPKGAAVTVRVVGHVLGDKVRIGKYRPKNGYRRHNGFRSRLTQIQVETIATASDKRRKIGRPAEQEDAKSAPSELPQGYGDLTVVEVAGAAPSWAPNELSAALAYERAHAGRKGALEALEAASKEVDG